MVKLSLKNLSKRYANFAVENVSFDIPSGSVVGLIGENGAGKSTIIKSILGVVRPDNGEIMFNGKNIYELTHDEKQMISFVYDDVALPLDLNMATLNKVLSKVYKKWDSEKFNLYLAKFNLPIDNPLNAFSKGMKMKAAMAVAFSHESELLVLDEPTSGLDPVVRDEILELLYDYNQQDDHAILLSSHITTDLEKICDYIVYIHNGKIVLNEEKDNLLNRYAVYPVNYMQLKEISQSAIVRVIKRDYGIDVLAIKERMPETFVGKQISLDDIMLFYSKGEIL